VNAAAIAASNYFMYSDPASVIIASLITVGMLYGVLKLCKFMGISAWDQLEQG
jgi:hypothetical protein